MSLENIGIAWDVAGFAVGVIGIAVGIYGIRDARKQRSKKDQAIDELKSFAKSTETFLIGLKPSIPSTTYDAVHDHVSRAKQSLEKVEALA